MKTKYKHIHFEKHDDDWICRDNKYERKLGTVVFYQDWRKYCLRWVSDLRVFSSDYLRDIADFLEQLNKKKREEK